MPSDVPTVPGFYWATCDWLDRRAIVELRPTGENGCLQVWHVGQQHPHGTVTYSDWSGPIADPRGEGEARKVDDPAQPEAFQVGDVVECVDAKPKPTTYCGLELVEGMPYYVASATRDGIRPKGCEFAWDNDRFRLVHRPGRVFSESQIVEAFRKTLVGREVTGETVLDAFEDVAASLGMSQQSVSRLGVELEDK